MKCLSCDTPLTNVTEKTLFNKISYDICESCGGLWLDRGELDKITVQTPGSVEESTLDYLKRHQDKNWDEYLEKSPLFSYRPCLRCPDHTMIKAPFMDDKKIVLDFCRSCHGLWLDGGELKKVNAYIRWFDEKAKPSEMDHFLKHLHSTFWHRIIVKSPT